MTLAPQLKRYSVSPEDQQQRVRYSVDGRLLAIVSRFEVDLDVLEPVLVTDTRDGHGLHLKKKPLAEIRIDNTCHESSVPRRQKCKYKR